MAKQQQQQKNAHVPKFGNWDNDGNVPYTLYFDNARKRKGGPAGGKMMKPNDPVENPEAFSSSFAAPSPNRSEGRTPPPSSPPPHHHERQPSDAPPLSPNPYTGSPYHRPAAGGEPPRRGAGGGRTGAGAGGSYSVEQSPSPSPLHPYSQSGADYSESSGYGLVANSVERSRAGRGCARGNETPTRGSAVPKFGDWDSNPASADGYTHIFNKAREEKQTQGVKTPGFSKDIAHGNGSKQHDDGYASSSGWCFGWCK